jgi:hypothetical protein
MKSLTIALLACTLLLGCGGRDDPMSIPDGGLPTDGGSPATIRDSASPVVSGPVSLAMMTTELGKVFCEKIFKCCTAAQRNPQFGTDVNTCQVFLSAALDSKFAGVRDGVANGRIGYDADKMGVCVAKVSRASCDLLNMPDPPECKEALVPKVPVGGGCGDSQDCIGGWCTQATGTCRALKADSQDCALDDECESDSCNAAGKCSPPSADANSLCQ